MPQETKRARIEREVRESMTEGIYQVGEKLPSARDLANRHRASIGTAVAALAALKDAGVIEGRQGDGYYVADLAAAQPAVSAETRLDELAQRVAELDEHAGFLEAVLRDLYGRLGYPWPGDADQTTTTTVKGSGGHGRRHRPSGTDG